MARLSKDEIIADAILDAATPKAAKESSFPEIIKSKAPVKKTAAPKKETAAKVEEAPALNTDTNNPLNVNPQAVSTTNANKDGFQKTWYKFKTLGLGMKVIILLIAIGLFSELVKHL